MKTYQGKPSRRAIRDYGKRRYGNPLFRQGTRSGRGAGIDAAKVKRAVVIVLAAAVFGALAWYLLWSGSFHVGNVEVNGASPDTEAVIRELVDGRLRMTRAFILPQASIFVFDSEAARADIAGEFYFDDLGLRKRLPGTLVIDVSEKEMAAALFSESRFMALDASGFAVRDLTERESMMMDDLPDGMGAVAAGELGAEAVDVAEFSGAEPEDVRRNDNPYPLVFHKSGTGKEVKPGDSALSESALALILQAYALLPDVTGAGVRWFTVDSAAETVDVTLKTGWSVFLTTLLPFDVQRERLSLVLKEKIGDRRAELEYVDLRYDERIFFRLKESDE